MIEVLRTRLPGVHFGRESTGGAAQKIAQLAAAEQTRRQSNLSMDEPDFRDSDAKPEPA
jgi:hypothetical protein